MDGSPSTTLLGPNGEWGEIEWQAGPILLHGRNGILLEELLEDIIIPRLEGFNRPEIPNPELLSYYGEYRPAPAETIPNPFRCRENSLAITHLEEALLWLKRRTELRQKAGVEGTYNSRPGGG